MDDRPIGVFDSGLGGLTTVKRLSELLPDEDIVYLGDTGRVPYGTRSRETILRYARQDAAFLMGYNIKAMVVACNTACSVGLDELVLSVPVPVYGVIEEPSVRAARTSRNNRIGVIGTPATIRSGAYEKAISAIMPDAEVTSAACPLFVPMVENGRVGAGDIVIETLAREYLTPLIERGIDTLILGCTHYPLLLEVIYAVTGPGITLVDSGEVTAERVAWDMVSMGLIAARRGGARQYFITDSTEGFSKMASLFLRADVGGAVTQVELE